MCWWLNPCRLSFVRASKPKTEASVRRSKNAKMMFAFPSEYFVRPKASSNFIPLHFDNFIRSALWVRLHLSAGLGGRTCVRACGCFKFGLIVRECVYVWMSWRVSEWVNEWMWMCLVLISRSNLLKLSSLLTLPSDVNNLEKRNCRTKYFVKLLALLHSFVFKVDDIFHNNRKFMWLEENQQETGFVSIKPSNKQHVEYNADFLSARFRFHRYTHSDMIQYTVYDYRRKFVKDTIWIKIQKKMRVAD